MLDQFKSSELVEQLNHSRWEIDQWVSLQKKLLEDSKQQHQKMVTQLEDTIRTLDKTEKNLKVEADQLQQVLLKEQQEIETLNREIASLKQKESKVPEHLETERRKLQAARETLEKHKQELAEKEKTQRNLVKGLTLGTAFYRERLGLDFERIAEDRLRFIFTNVDPDNHSRRFTFSVFIDAQDKYQVLECSPSLDCIGQMVDELNKSNNFSGFIQKLRRKFKELCSTK